MTIKYAVVTLVNADVYAVKFIGEEYESLTVYTKLATYKPVVGDKVAFLVDIKGKYLCLGKVS